MYIFHSFLTLYSLYCFMPIFPRNSSKAVLSSPVNKLIPAEFAFVGPVESYRVYNYDTPYTTNSHVLFSSGIVNSTQLYFAISILPARCPCQLITSSSNCSIVATERGRWDANANQTRFHSSHS